MPDHLQKCLPALVLAATVVAAPPQTQAEPDDSLEVLGLIETVQIGKRGFELDAKLDTGADNSSLHAVDIEAFKRNDMDWVRFKVELDNGDSEEFEYPKVRTASIQRAAGGEEDRPVVELGVCVGSVFQEVEVNLTDRSELTYPMLIGASFLEDNILVDSGPEHTTDPRCDVENSNWIEHE